MRQFPVAAVLLAATAWTMPLFAQAKPDTAAPAGSFLHRQARSVTQLVREVGTDPAARRRFARYFHRPERDISAYLQHTLLPGSLPRGGDYTVFFVAGSGLVYPTRMDLRPGTAVFTGRDGRPILLQGTGNPLTPFATAVETRVILSDPTVIVGGSQEQLITAAPTDIPVPAAAPMPVAPAATRSANSDAP